MNILYHFRTRGTGGEGVHISGIITALRKLGYKVEALSPSGVDPVHTKGESPYGQKEKTDFFSWISLHIPYVFFEALEILYNIVDYFLLLKTLREKRVDIIYERYAFFLFAGVLTAKRRNIPIIVEINEISGHERVRKQILVAVARWIERYIFRNAQLIVVISEFLKAEIEKMGVDPRKIHIIPNGVDMSEINDSLKGYMDIKKKVNPEEKLIIIGFVGWFVKWHRLDMLLDVFARIVQNGFGNMKLMLIGEGPLRKDLERQTKELGIEDRVIFAGAVKYKDVFKYIASTDICIIPSSNEYRSPIKLFEYMACKKPVVVPDTPPVASIVRDGDNGIIFKNGDWDGLMRGILRLINDGELRRKIGEAAGRDIANNYTWLHHAQKIMELYHRRNTGMAEEVSG